MRWSLGTKLGLVLLSVGLALSTSFGVLGWRLGQQWRAGENLASTLAISLGVCLALLGVGWSACRVYVLRPARESREGARRILSGELAHRVPIRAQDELGAVADSLNQLAAGLGRLQLESRQTRAALETSDNRHRRLFESTLAGVLRSTLDGEILGCNETLARMYGYSTPAEVLGRVEDSPFGAVRAFVARLQREKRLTHLEIEGKRKDGSPVVALANLTLLEDEKPVPLIEAVLVDITRRKQAEETVRSLLRIGERLNSRLDIDALLDELVREAASLVEAEGGWAGLRAPQGMMTRKALLDSGEIPFPYCWPAGQGLPGWLLEHPGPYLTNDATSDPQITPELTARFGIRSAIAVPILDAHGEVIGFFEIHNKRSGSGFGAFDEEKLLTVSRAVSIAIQNALAYRKVLRADEALRLSEQRYRELVENANDIIYTRDLAGNFTSFNRAAERITGYSLEEALKMNIAQITASDSPKVSAPLGQPRGADGGPATYDLEIAAKDGRRLSLEVSTRLIYEDGRPVGVQGIARDVTERKRAERALRQLSGHLLRFQDTERRRIARELHDSTAQTLAALAMNLARVKEAGASLDAQAARAVDESLELAASCSREIRTLSYLLHPPLLDELGLSAALRWYADGFAQRSGIRVDLDVTPKPGRLRPDVELALFRIVQESLTNIHRHSGSSRAMIRVAIAPSEVVLRVSDEGHGMPHEGSLGPAVSGVGVGIAGMRERVSQLGGRLEIRSGHRGTIVEAALPLVQSPS